MEIGITLLCILLLTALVAVDIAKHISKYVEENNIEIFSFKTLFYALLFLQLFIHILLFINAFSKIRK